MKNSERVEHTIAPFVFKEAKVLILGTIPSPKSREQGFYYAHPQNRFWKVLATVFEKTIPQSIEDKKNFLLTEKIALWDVLSECYIVGAGDASIKNEKPNDVQGIIVGTEIKSIFTTGKTACKLLSKLQGIKSICLPSTSPANCSVSFNELVEKYSEIKKVIKENCNE